MKKNIWILTALLFAVFLSACQASPQKEAVVRRNDGAFDANAVQPAEECHAPEQTEALSVQDAFQSTDGSVTFQIAVQNSIHTPNMPVVEVVPHTLSEEEARNAALALCGTSAHFYEAEPILNERYSKDDILAQIDRWASLASVEGMQYLFPNGADFTWESDAQTLRESIAYLTSTYLNDDAPDYAHTPCQWTFKPSSHYLYGAEGMDGVDTSRDNEEISVWASNGEGRYSELTISRRDRKDYKLNNIYYNATISGPLMVEYALYRAEKLRTEHPNEAQIENAVCKAQAIMEQMDLGTWKVIFSDVEVNQAGEVTEYIIHLNAVPVFENVAAIHRPQLSNLKSQTVYASNYYLTEATFDFSADGTLMNFTLYSPVDVKQVLHENVKTMTSDQLFSRAKEHLALSDAYAYGASLERIGTGYDCTVTISQVEYGLTRTKVPNTDESYYYVPAAVFRGTVEYRMQDATDAFYYREDVPLLMLNAVDGSVIPLDNES